MFQIFGDDYGLVNLMPRVMHLCVRQKAIRAIKMEEEREKNKSAPTRLELGECKLLAAPIS